MPNRKSHDAFTWRKKIEWNEFGWKLEKETYKYIQYVISMKNKILCRKTLSFHELK